MNALSSPVLNLYALLPRETIPSDSARLRRIDNSSALACTAPAYSANVMTPRSHGGSDRPINTLRYSSNSLLISATVGRPSGNGNGLNDF